ncbi:hypothetical protein M408DRAFT_155763 [Serendipita vermifera MAFF 305830]|uniref:Uncharacterized protein n=1 Tax=Serendipita vermifera MAFF 305830 TaxID=933852 RepID=A0A0C2XXC7_SERVB|nr:hypothetical protein M408DRAFT_155763 [Serendipita vermifera MAFF 305830]
MSKQLKENEEEEKRNGVINVAELLPSPYTQYPPSFSPTQGTLGYPPSDADVYRRSAASPASGSHILSRTSQSPGDHIVETMAGAGVATQYTPTHSRDGSFSTQAPGRPPSSHHQPHLASPSSHMEDPSPNEPTATSSAKAREAFQHRRRSALYAQNAGEEDGEDIIIPANAQPVRSTVPPSAWGVPPPAYSPGG